MLTDMLKTIYILKFQIFYPSINVREHRRGNKNWTIQRKWQYTAHKTKKKTQQKYETICVGHHYAQTNTNMVKKT